MGDFITHAFLHFSPESYLEVEYAKRLANAVYRLVVYIRSLYTVY